MRSLATASRFLHDASNSPEPNVAPQSHFVNARLSDDWDKQVGEHRVLGHSEWLSTPIKLHLTRDESTATTESTTTTESPRQHQLRVVTWWYFARR